MSLSRAIERKVDSKGRVHKEEWKEKYASILSDFTNAKQVCFSATKLLVLAKSTKTATRDIAWHLHSGLSTPDRGTKTQIWSTDCRLCAQQQDPSTRPHRSTESDKCILNRGMGAPMAQQAIHWCRDFPRGFGQAGYWQGNGWRYCISEIASSFCKVLYPPHGRTVGCFAELLSVVFVSPSNRNSLTQFTNFQNKGFEFCMKLSFLLG